MPPIVGITRLGLGLLAASPSASLALVGHTSQSSTRNQAMGSPWSFTFFLPDPSTAGNAIVVDVSFANNVTWSASDDKGNSYSVGKKTSPVGGRGTVILGAFATTGGAQAITVTASGDPGQFIQPKVTQYANVTGFGAGTGTGNGTGTAVSCAVTLAAGEVAHVNAVAISNGGSNTWSTAGTLLSADTQDGFAAQYGATSFTLGSSSTWTASGVALVQGKAGSVPGGIRCAHCVHINAPGSAGAGGTGSHQNPMTVHFPSVGSAFIAMLGGSTGATSSSITDTKGNTWTQKVSELGFQLEDAEIRTVALPDGAPIASNDLTLTVTWVDATKDGSIVLCDMVGMTTIDATQHGHGSQGSSGTLTMFSITPTTSPGYGFVTNCWDFNTAKTGPPFLTQTGFFDGESQSGPAPIDENNLWAIGPTSGTSPLSCQATGLFSLQFGDWTACALVGH